MGEIVFKNIVSEAIIAEEVKPKRVLGRGQHRRCRFCGKSRPETTFSSDAHVIPAAFGNRSLFSNEECDTCNQIGSQYEDDLAKFLALPRVLSRIRGRKKAPKLKDPREQSYTHAIPEKNLVYLHQANDEQSYQVSEKSGQLEIVSKIPVYRPVNVARSLGRMALFLLDPNSAIFSSLHSWVRGDREYFPMPMEVLNIPGRGTREVRISLCKYLNFRDRELVVMRFRFFTMVVSVAFPIDEKPLPVDLPLMNYILRGMNVSEVLTLRENTSRFIIKSDVQKKDDSLEVTLHYSSKKEVKSLEEVLGNDG